VANREIQPATETVIYSRFSGPAARRSVIVAGRLLYLESI